MRVYDSTFDGRVFTGLLLVCAGNAPAHFNSDLSYETFQVLGVAGCTTAEPVRHLTIDAVAGRVRTLKALPHTCVGRVTTIRLTETDSPPLGECVRVTFGALLLSEKGKSMGFVRTVHTLTTSR